MAKVVYNDDYGGFKLSSEAIEWLEENASTRTKELIKKIRKEVEDDRKVWNVTLTTEEMIAFRYSKIVARHDNDLVKVVETLGSKANGTYSYLKIYELKGNDYRIAEYDGMEDVVEKCDEKYIHVED